MALPLRKQVVERLQLSGICSGDMMQPKSPFFQNFRAHQSVTSTRSNCRELPPTAPCRRKSFNNENANIHTVATSTRGLMCKSSAMLRTITPRLRAAKIG
jgi:hypothetical protein